MNQAFFARNVTGWREKLPALYHGHFAYIDFESLGVVNPRPGVQFNRHFWLVTNSFSFPKLGSSLVMKLPLNLSLNTLPKIPNVY